MGALIIRPKDQEEKNSFLELANKLGTNVTAIESDDDERLFQAMEYNKNSPKVSKEKVLNTINQIYL